MPTLTRRILDHYTLTAGASMDLADAIDAGECTVLELVATVHTATTGAAPLFVVEHAAVNEEDAYMPFEEPFTVDLTTTGQTWRHIEAHTRFLLWSVSGTLDGEVELTLDLVGKS